MDTEKQFLQFDETGYLKAGLHNCSWEVLQKLAFTNSHRVIMGDKLLNFLRWPLRTSAFSKAYVCGGFVSNRPFPQDIDVVLETRYPFGPDAFSALEPFFARGLDNILRVYSVHLHFWMDGAPKAFADYRSFFQYRRPQASSCFNSDKRGIVALSLVPEAWSAHLESDPEIKPSDRMGRLLAEKKQLRSVAQ